MGLDQAVRKLSQESLDLIMKWRASGEEDGYPDVEVEEVWVGRKENHIQHYVDTEVGEVDNCDYLPLTKEDVERLVDRLRRVNEDHSLAAQLLPTQDGFFFGGTEYDEWYFEDVKSELDAFTQILKDWDDDAVYAYWAWW
jgi:hypothetical protein